MGHTFIQGGTHSRGKQYGGTHSFWGQTLWGHTFILGAHTHSGVTHSFWGQTIWGHIFILGANIMGAHIHSGGTNSGGTHSFRGHTFILGAYNMGANSLGQNGLRQTFKHSNILTQNELWQTINIRCANSPGASILGQTARGHTV